MYIHVLLFGRQIFYLFLFLPASLALSALTQANGAGPSFTEISIDITVNSKKIRETHPERLSTME